MMGGGDDKSLFINEKETNLRNEGLISTDRSNKATLLFTIPCSLIKSSTKDSSTQIFEIIIHGSPMWLFSTQAASVCYDFRIAPIRIRLTFG